MKPVHMITVSTPVVLPEGWNAYESCPGEIVIRCIDAKGDFLGAITVSEKDRAFTPGFSFHIKPGAMRREYRGIGWKVLLYSDAVSHLQDLFKDELRSSKDSHAR